MTRIFRKHDASINNHVIRVVCSIDTLAPENLKAARVTLRNAVCRCYESPMGRAREAARERNRSHYARWQGRWRHHLGFPAAWAF